jgi:hypothetical protein
VVLTVGVLNLNVGDSLRRDAVSDWDASAPFDETEAAREPWPRAFGASNKKRGVVMKF